MSNIDTLLEEKRDRLKHLCQHIKTGLIVECGCGSGFVLGVLSSSFPGNQIIGIDNDFSRLSTAALKKMTNVNLICSDLTDWPIKKRCVGTLLFIDSLHVICSNSNKKMGRDTIRKSTESLINGGVLCIDDFIKPIPQRVKLLVKNVKVIDCFKKFAREFQPRKINFELSSKHIELDLADALEFIEIYPSYEQKSWCDRMKDSHFFFTEREFHRIATDSGLKITNSSLFFEQRNFHSEIKKVFEFDFDYAFPRIQLILEK